MQKYGSKKTICDNITFSSKAEAKRYQQLKLLKASGEVKYFLRQTPFHLPGGVKYLCDFFVVWKNGDISVEDVKGFKTQIYIMKKKQVEELYNVTIKEIKV
jgi:hypothetical protein